jgi:hypothetical protein
VVGDVTYAQYDIGSVRDICRARGRYVWVKDGTQTFGVTDLEDESHPDRFRPFYSAESQPDGIIGCGVWRDFVVMFGSSTIEYFSLTGATDSTSAIYVSQTSLMVQKGSPELTAKPSSRMHSHLSAISLPVRRRFTSSTVGRPRLSLPLLLRRYSANIPQPNWLPVCWKR